MFKLRTLFLLSLFLLVSCTNQPQGDNKSLSVGVTTNLSTYRNAIYHCSLANKQSVKVDAFPLNTLLSGKYDAVVQVGQPASDRILPIQVGKVRLVFIINPQNPLPHVNTSQLAAIFLGMVDDWQKVAPATFSTLTPIKTWSYPAGDDVRQLVETLLLEERKITPRSSIAPDAQAMVEAVSKDPTAIGFLLDINPQSNVKLLSIIPDSTITQVQPIIASFSTIPEGDLKELMVCLPK